MMQEKLRAALLSLALMAMPASADAQASDLSSPEDHCADMAKALLRNLDLIAKFEAALADPNLGASPESRKQTDLDLLFAKLNYPNFWDNYVQQCPDHSERNRERLAPEFNQDLMNLQRPQPTEAEAVSWSLPASDKDRAFDFG